MQARRNRKRIWALAFFLIVPASWGAVEIWYRVYRPKRFAAVEEAVLYRSALPSARQLAHLKQDYGIQTVLIARKGSGESVEKEIAYAKEQGIDVVHIPIESYGEIPQSQIDQFWECINSARRPILIHCMAGRHRTGFLCALYRIERQGWSVERAVDELLSYGFDTGRHGDIVEQLRRYRPQRAVTSSAGAEGTARRVRTGS